MRRRYVSILRHELKVTRTSSDLLSALHEQHTSETTPVLAIDLPPSAALTAPFPTSQQSIAQKRIPQCHISEILHASRLALALIDVILDIPRSQKGCSVPLTVDRNLRVWIAERCSRFWQTHPRWPLWCGSRHSAQSFTESYLRVLRLAIAVSSTVREATVLVQAICDLLSHRAADQLDRLVQREITKDILGIWELSSRIDAIKQLSRDQFTSIFLKFRASSFSSSALAPELKVWTISLILTHFI